MVLNLKLQFLKQLINLRRQSPTLRQSKLAGCRFTVLLGMMARSLQ